MKKPNQFTKSERVISLISIIWIIVAFLWAREQENLHFIEAFFIFGLIPAVLLIGVKWIMSADKS